MDRKAILKKFEDELRQARKNFQEGKCIPLEEFDWGLPFQVSESRAEYRIDPDA